MANPTDPPPERFRAELDDGRVVETWVPQMTVRLVTEK